MCKTLSVALREKREREQTGEEDIWAEIGEQRDAENCQTEFRRLRFSTNTIHLFCKITNKRTITINL